jgi:hypothetical protein
MTLDELYNKQLINDETTIYIRGIGIYTKGNWYQDNIIKYHDAEIDNFNYYVPINHIFAYLKE